MSSITTGWMYTDARVMVSCPRCGQEEGNYCRTPGGRKTKQPHVERVLKLKEHPDYKEENYIRGTGRF